jgi:hypothetical protein
MNVITFYNYILILIRWPFHTINTKANLGLHSVALRLAELVQILLSFQYEMFLAVSPVA